MILPSLLAAAALAAGNPGLESEECRRADESVACAVMHKNLPALRRRLDLGDDPNPTAKDGFPLLLTAVGLPGGEEAAELLLRRGADPNTLGPDGFAPLNLAAGLGKERLVAALLAKKADPNAASAGGVTALWTATDAKIIRRLLAAGALPDPRREKDGATPLIYAACAGQFERVRALLAGGADPALKDAAGQTAASCAKARDHGEIAIYILAEQGQRDAQYVLGLQYEGGYLGLKRDDARAYLYYSLAAKQGERSAALKVKKLAMRLSSSEMARAVGLLKSWRPAPLAKGKAFR